MLQKNWQNLTKPKALEIEPGEDAKRIAMKWLKTNLNWYNRHGVFLEKFNVVNPDKPPVKGVYPSQTGFGWTNGVLLKLIAKYDLPKQ